MKEIEGMVACGDEKVVELNEVEGWLDSSDLLRSLCVNRHLLVPWDILYCEADECLPL